ncbi:MAG: hypothetical protein SV186_03600 [Candidatus Nanohaloarchaea archaeon]|nr:hypothetical protein [Candidatus Nanohaloarchaea archaeon]
MVVDGLPAGVDEVYKWAHTDIEDNDPIDLESYLEDREPGYEQTELDDFDEDTPDYRGDPQPRVVNTQFMGRRNYAREPGRTTDFEW